MGIQFSNRNHKSIYPYCERKHYDPMQSSMSQLGIHKMANYNHFFDLIEIHYMNHMYQALINRLALTYFKIQPLSLSELPDRSKLFTKNLLQKTSK